MDEQRGRILAGFCGFWGRAADFVGRCRQPENSAEHGRTMMSGRIAWACQQVLLFYFAVGWVET